MRLPKIKISLPKIIAVLTLVQQGVEMVKRLWKRGGIPSQDNQPKEGIDMDAVKKLSDLRAKLAAAGKNNVLILWIISQLDMILVMAAGQAPEEAAEIVRDAAKTVQIWIKYALRYAEKTETPYDDAVFTEIAEAAGQLAG